MHRPSSFISYAICNATPSPPLEKSPSIHACIHAFLPPSLIHAPFRYSGPFEKESMISPVCLYRFLITSVIVFPILHLPSNIHAFRKG